MTTPLQRLAYRLERIEKNQRAASSTPQLGTSSIENDGTLREYAYDGTLLQEIGKQVDGTHTTAQFNGPIPPAPTKPVVSSIAGAAQANWDGNFVGGAMAPFDFARIDVHLIANSTDDPLLVPPSTSIIAQSWANVALPQAPGDYYVVFITWTTSGKYAISEVSNAITVSPPPTSDGAAPTVAPVLAAEPFAIGQVEFSWPAIANGADKPTYDLWVSTTTPVVKNATTYAGFTDGNTFKVGRVEGADIPTTTPTLVYGVVAARDADPGTGPDSNEASATARSADGYITALFIAALEIEANQIKAGTFTADLGVVGKLLIGNRNEINGEDGSIVIYAPDLDSEGNKVPLIELRPEGSTFRGRVIADDVSVMDGLVLQGIMSQIAAGGGMTIMAGVADPTQTPSLAATVQTVSSAIFPAPPAGHLHRGWCDHPTAGKISRLLWESSPSVIKVQTINIATGTVDSTLTLGQVPSIGENAVSALAYYGGSYFSVVQDWNQEAFGPGNGLYDMHYLVRWNATTGAYQDISTDFQATANTDRSATYATLGIGYDTFPRIIMQLRAAPDNPNMIEFDDPGNLATMVTVEMPVEKLVYIGRGSYDVGVGQYIGGHAASTSVLTSYDNFITLQPLGAGPTPRYQWSVPAGAEVHWHDTENVFYAISGNALYRYSGYYPAASEKAYVTYAHTGSGLTTLDSPAESVAIPARRFLSVSLPGYPVGVTSADVFMGLGSTLPIDANLKKRAETLTTVRTMFVNPAVAGGAATPPAANTFGPGGSGWLKTALGDVVINGDGTGDWPYLSAKNPLAATWLLTADTSIANSTTTVASALTLNAARSNVKLDATYLTLASGVFTVVKAGTYRIIMRAKWDKSATGNRYLFSYFDGTNQDETSAPGKNEFETCVVEYPFITLTAGQTFGMRVRQNSGAALNLLGGAIHQSSYVYVEYLGDHT